MFLVLGMLIGIGACFISVARVRFPGAVAALLLVVFFLLGYLFRMASL
jgi:hypothetical protein